MGLDLAKVFRTVDAMDARAFADFFTDDGLFKFGNSPTAKGKEEIAGVVTDFFASIQALRHTVVEQWDDAGTEICEVDVVYTRHDGNEVPLSAACIFRMDADRIADYRIYMDISPLYA